MGIGEVRETGTTAQKGTEQAIRTERKKQAAAPAGRVITPERMEAFRESMIQDEKSRATIEKYTLAVRRFAGYLAGEEVTKAALLAYRDRLLAAFLPQTVNGSLTAIRAFLAFHGWEDCGIRLLKVQRRPFLDESRELSREEYRALVEAAGRLGKRSLQLILETIGSTGIRISELQYFTVEAVHTGRIHIRNKGKTRIILMPARLKGLLLAFARSRSITKGVIFRTRNGRPLDRSNIAHEMKKLCQEAGVDASKVFPHNLRHLFARSYYEASHNLALLADILGHSSIETTRIYIAVSATEHEEILGRMQLLFE